VLAGSGRPGGVADGEGDRDGHAEQPGRGVDLAGAEHGGDRSARQQRDTLGPADGGAGSGRHPAPFGVGRAGDEQRQIQADLDGSTPAGASATAAVVAAHIDTTRAIAVEFTAAGHAEPEQWRDAAVLNNADLWLTAEEFQRVGEELGAVIAPYRRRTRPAGTRQVRVMNVVVPRQLGRPEPGSREA
jgi:hypothetical protein